MPASASRSDAVVESERLDKEATMRLQVTVRHGQVNDAIRGYVETKFRKLERRLHDATQIDVVLDRERNPKIANDHVVEATIHAKGPTLHGRESATSYEAAATDLPDRQAGAAGRALPGQARTSATVARPEPTPSRSPRRSRSQSGRGARGAGRVAQGSGSSAKGAKRTRPRQRPPTFRATNSPDDRAGRHGPMCNDAVCPVAKP